MSDAKDHNQGQVDGSHANAFDEVTENLNPLSPTAYKRGFRHGVQQRAKSKPVDPVPRTSERNRSNVPSGAGADFAEGLTGCVIESVLTVLFSVPIAVVYGLMFITFLRPTWQRAKRVAWGLTGTLFLLPIGGLFISKLVPLFKEEFGHSLDTGALVLGIGASLVYIGICFLSVWGLVKCLVIVAGNLLPSDAKKAA